MLRFQNQFKKLKNQLILDSFENVELIISSLSDEEWIKKPKGCYCLTGELRSGNVYPSVCVDPEHGLILFFNSQGNFSRLDGLAKIAIPSRFFNESEYFITAKDRSRIIQTCNAEEYWNHPLVLAMKKFKQEDRQEAIDLLSI